MSAWWSMLLAAGALASVASHAAARLVRQETAAVRSASGVMAGLAVQIARRSHP